MGGDFGDKKTSSETGSHFYNSNNTTTTVSGLPADNLILKPFQTELSQRALFLGKVVSSRPSSSTTIAGGKLLGI